MPARLSDGTWTDALYPERHKRLVEGCRRGLFDSQNALREGIHPDTLKSWVERGLDPDAKEPYRTFAEDYIKASIELEEYVIGRILLAAEEFEAEQQSREVTRKTATLDADGFSEPGEEVFTKTKRGKARERGDWRAAAWFAERRWPLRWGNRAPDGGPKEALKLPDSPIHRQQLLRSRLVPPPPELVKLYREAGYSLDKLDAPDAVKAPG